MGGKRVFFLPTGPRGRYLGENSRLQPGIGEIAYRVSAKSPEA